MGYISTLREFVPGMSYLPKVESITSSDAYSDDAASISSYRRMQDSDNEPNASDNMSTNQHSAGASSGASSFVSSATSMSVSHDNSDEEDDTNILSDSEYLKKLSPASNQHQKDFRRIFKPSPVPESEKLYKVFSCAISKEILHHGRLFVTRNYFLFHSNIFNVVHKIVIPIQNITLLEPRRTMSIFPNAIYVQIIDGQGYAFVSFTNRNRTLSLLRHLRNNREATVDDEPMQPRFSGSIKTLSRSGSSAVNLHRHGTDASIGAKTSAAAQLYLNGSSSNLNPNANVPSPIGSLDDNGRASTCGTRARTVSGSGSVAALSASSSLSNRDSSPHRPRLTPRHSRGFFPDPTNAAHHSNLAIENVAENAVDLLGGHHHYCSTITRTPSEMTRQQNSNHSTAKTASTAGASTNSGTPTTTGGKKWPMDNLGPDEHAKTQLPEPAEHEKVLATETIRAPPGVVANILFGNDTSWYKHFLVDDEHNRDLDTLPPFPSLHSGSERKFEYVKPLSGPVGPKQTHCKSTEKIERWDFNSYVEVFTTTATPDVPSGNSFTTLTRAIIAWGDNNTTVVRLGTWLEWTGKTWLKVAIEKGAVEGQTSYCKSLVAELGRTIDNAKPGGGSGSSARTEMKPAGTHADDMADGETSKATKRSSTAKKAAQAIEAWEKICIGLIITIIVLLIVIIVMWRKKRVVTYSPESRRDLMRIQQELELWQWIDDRRDATARMQKTLSDANIEEAIAATEKKLASLKASLG